MTGKRSGAKIIVDILKEEGIKYVFGLPGTTIMPLLDELYDQKEIRFISVRHEQVAAFMADGYSRACAKGDLGVCLASRGPGAANMAIGLHNAFEESVPVLALIGQVSADHYYRGAFEELDLCRFFDPITKWSVEIHQAKRLPELLQRAIRTAVSGRPRPVMVSIPFNLMEEKVERASVQPRYRVRPPLPAPSAIGEAMDLLAQAKRPVMILGGGAIAAREDLVKLAEALHIPVLTSWLRKDLFPNDHFLSFGTLGYGAFEVSERMVREADVIMAVGCRFSEFTTKKWTLIPPGAKLIHVDIDPEELGKVYIPDVGLWGDASYTVREMLKQIKDGQFMNLMRAERKAWVNALSSEYAQERIIPQEASSPSGVPSGPLVRALQDVIDKFSPVLVMDVPTFGVWAQRYLTIKEAHKYYGCAGGSMGWGFPAAMGIQLARPEEVVVAISGDGSFWMVAQDLETAVRENIPVINVIINNFAYGNTRDRQKNTYGGRYLGVFYQNPDFEKFAQLLGVYGERVESADQLLPAIERAIRSGKPAVINVIQDRFEGLPPGLTPLGAVIR